jgi:hypothetical protein
MNGDRFLIDPRYRTLDCRDSQDNCLSGLHHYGAGGNFHYATGINVDYVMETLERPLDCADAAISRCIEKTMAESPAYVLHAVYPPNRSAEARAALSSLELLLG